MRLVSFILIAATASRAAVGDSPHPAPIESLFIAHADLAKIEDSASGGFSKRLFTTPNYSDSFIRIAMPDKPHAHGRWSEVYLIVSGAATIETGGSIAGAVEGNSATHGALFLDKPATAPVIPVDPDAPKDLAGTDIVGGHIQQMRAGDVILIPAGVPHRWLSVEEPIVYHDIKFPR